MDGDGYGNVRQWQASYKACDTLYMMTASDSEQFGDDQMSKLDSELSIHGREICRQVSEKTGRKTYYYLSQSKAANIHDEVRRRCPECSGDWLLFSKLHNLFSFRCDRCMLLSNIAFDIDDLKPSEEGSGDGSD